MTEAEFLPLFDRYRSMVYGLALNYIRSPQDAEDVCQSVFLKLMEAPPAPGKENAARSCPAHHAVTVLHAIAAAATGLRAILPNATKAREQISSLLLFP